ncbi:cobalt-precorrin 5A hydrolase [Kineothrix sp. MSJ-39]|uniref:cobalt-precorrin 5A hydrolase n=1 Tax=Kineothrix sp. MSJ-39 TaxID=2841533 RepID=UPI001C0FD391|nr:cobalt-precorrin 5A hydrolase [Kineothrix sp. MSJ-39]MBU5430177.1 cobalt-precorrin 5A hydrolase [Kineothrix sp. MSJ-39]
MVIRVCVFTEQGRQSAEQLTEKMPSLHLKWREDEPLQEWTGEAFADHQPILFIGACGIAVRAIAPFVQDKLTDSPVLVMDEKGRHIIPILSGHIGGANELACRLAEAIGAEPVLTTATDVNHIFAVDVFAKENGLRIANREGIRYISDKLLRGQQVSVQLDKAFPFQIKEVELPEGLVLYDKGKRSDLDPDLVIFRKKNGMAGSTQALYLTVKPYVLGIGCKKGKSLAELRSFVQRHVTAEQLQNCYAIASIDLKAEEVGLQELAQYYGVPLITYSSEVLSQVEGTFSESDFVKETTGVGSVCERAAVCLGKGQLLQRKIAEDGMTLAIAERIPEKLDFMSCQDSLLWRMS